MTRRVLVTGGTGLVGGAIVEALPTDLAVISLTRHGAGGWSADDARALRPAGALVAVGGGHVVGGCDAPHVEHVRGDMTQPRLGLSTAAYAALAARVDVVIHAAGVTDYTTPRAVMEALNVTGTRRVAQFAQEAGAPLYHVSTGYIDAQGASVRGRYGAQVYLDSKRAAEQVAGESATLAAVVRPSLVFGHSHDGSAASFQGLHRLIGLLLENQLPLLPFAAATRVDYLPRDLVGQAIARCALDGFTGELWVTAGEHAPTFGRVVELLRAFAGEHGRHVHPPRFVTQEMIDRLLRPMGGPALARRIELLLALTSHLVEQPLPSSLPAPPTELEAVLLRGTAWWARRTAWAPAARDAVPT